MHSQCTVYDRISFRTKNIYNRNKIYFNISVCIMPVFVCNIFKYFGGKELLLGHSELLQVTHSAAYVNSWNRRSADGISSPKSFLLWPLNFSFLSNQSGALDPHRVHHAPFCSGIWSRVENNEANNNVLKYSSLQDSKVQTTFRV